MVDERLRTSICGSLERLINDEGKYAQGSLGYEINSLGLEYQCQAARLLTWSLRMDLAFQKLNKTLRKLEKCIKTNKLDELNGVKNDTEV